VLMHSGSRLGLPGALSRQYFDHRQEGAYRDLVTTIAIGDVLASAAGTGLLFLIGPAIFERWMPEIVFHPAIDIALGIRFLMLLPELQSRLLQATEKSKVAASFSVSMSLFGMLVKVIMVIVLRLGVLGVLWGDLISSFAAATFAIVWHR